MTGLIILAAGESSRLGFPKQTLLYQGKTLLELAIEAGLESECHPVNVVLGANFKTIEKSIEANFINIIYNAEWAEGMASSIRIAIENIQKNREVNSVLVMLCDQPFVNAALLNALIAKQTETGKSIVACTYNNIIGVPALFTRKLFTELLLLQGQEGAKTILKKHVTDIAAVPFEQGHIDIDTPEDYEKLIGS